MMNRFLVIGLGNTLLCDDAAGPLAVRKARERLTDKFGGRVDYIENDSGSFDLLFEMTGYKRVLIIDSMLTGKYSPGACRMFSLDDLRMDGEDGYVNSHGVTLPSLMDAGRLFGYRMPDECLVMGIEVTDVTTFSLEMTMKVAAHLDTVVTRIDETLSAWIDSEK